MQMGPGLSSTDLMGSPMTNTTIFCDRSVERSGPILKERVRSDKERGQPTVRMSRKRPLVIILIRQ